jgi:hypothetical protein
MFTSVLNHAGASDMDRPIAVTISQAQKLSGLGRSKLYALFKSGDLRPRKAGKRTLILMEDLERFLRSLPTAA